MTIAFESVKDTLLTVQRQLVAAMETEEPNKTFYNDAWSYQTGGGGLSCVLEDGGVIERGGVNFSHVIGKELPPAATARNPHLAGKPFQAMGVSSVIHPLNPYAPTAHLNVRMFVADHEGDHPVWWFGGGFDLTPYYGVDEDCIAWHRAAKEACDLLGPDYYDRYKKWCDDYFYLKHRNEPRGIGGIFFDDLNEVPFDKGHEFIAAVGNAFTKTYQSIIHQHKDKPYTQRERDFQLYRRGRYVEFNLVYDRGTLFGLQSKGRTESILVSMPREVRWQYDWAPEAGTPEAGLYERYLVPKDWCKMA